MARKYYEMRNHKRKGFVRYYELTGEFRPPEAGEFYLSGAIPEVYYNYAENNLSTAYHIMQLIEPQEFIELNGLVYQLVRVAE